MKAGDFVEVEYVGKVKESGDIFDLTDEKLAKEKGIFNPRVKYGPIVLVLGAGFVIKGLDEELQKMSPGEKKMIVIPPEKAFGPRDDRLMRTFSIADFKAQGAEPKVGQFITLRDNISGKVISVAAGRVKVDFNHPLAGKNLEYDIKVNKLVTEKNAQVKAILGFHTGLADKDAEVSVDGAKAKILLKTTKTVISPVKKTVADDVMKHVQGIKEAEFVESFKKAEEKAEHKAK